MWLGAGAVLAQHEEPAQGTSTAEHAESTGHEAGGGNIMDVDPGLMIWTVVTFVALLVVLRLTAWKPMIAALEAREQRIRTQLERGEQAQREGEALLQRHREQLEAAAGEAHKILEAGKVDALRLRDEILREARQEGDDIKARGRREVELAADQAKKELWEESTRLATLLAAKIVQRSLDGNDHRRLVDEVLDELGSARMPAAD